MPPLAIYKGERPLFGNPFGRTPNKRWTGWAVRDEWKRAAKQAGFPNISMYEGTKHSTATALRRAGVPLDVIQAAAGHKDIRSTENYAQMADETINNALKKRR